MKMPTRARQGLVSRLEAENDGLWEALRSEMQAEGTEAAFWFRVASPAAIAPIAALLSRHAAELRAAYDETALSAGFVTALPDGVILWDDLEDGEILSPDPERVFAARPVTWRLTDYGPGAELFPVEIPQPPPPPEAEGAPG